MLVFNNVSNAIHVYMDKDNTEKEYRIRKNKIVDLYLHSQNAKKINENSYYFHSLNSDQKIEVMSYIGKVLKYDINDAFFDNVRNF